MGEEGRKSGEESGIEGLRLRSDSVVGSLKKFFRGEFRWLPARCL